jgi:hypothetical protein
LAIEIKNVVGAQAERRAGSFDVGDDIVIAYVRLRELNDLLQVLGTTRSLAIRSGAERKNHQCRYNDSALARRAPNPFLLFGVHEVFPETLSKFIS